LFFCSRKNMLWINFLHLYQPANADPETVAEASEKSYLRLVSALENHPHTKMTFNISGCLLLRWQAMGYWRLINRIKALLGRGQLEITGTAAYHPILPLVPLAEARQQIQDNEQILKEVLDIQNRPAGFFFPEMAYSPETGKLVRELGYQWAVLDEIHPYGRVGQAEPDRVYKDRASGLDLVLRSRQYSNSYVPDTLLELSDQQGRAVITGTDGELYGLRHEDPGQSFEKLLASQGLQTLTISEFIAKQSDRLEVEAVSASWESTEKELALGRPFKLWHDPDNHIQELQWQLAGLAQKIVNDNQEDDNYAWARWHLVRGLASCAFWWASEKSFEHIYGPKAWNPDEIERGTNELIRSVRALEGDVTRATKIKAEEVYIEIKREIWQRHWNYHWKREG